jgi:hypothetical protein
MAFNAEEFRTRLRSHLPIGWFPDDSPVLDAVLSGVAAQKSFLMDQLDYVGDQARIATLRDVFLDMFADDHFGPGVLPRKGSEVDDSYRERIKRELFRDRGTRPAMAEAIKDLTGNEPVIFEPMNVRDTGTYGGKMAYGLAGRYGSSLMPFQVLIDVKNTVTGGIPGVHGYAIGSSLPPARTRGGYGVGALIYSTPEMVKVDVSNQDVMDAINTTRPVGVTAWTKIT